MSVTAVPIQPLARGAVAKLWIGLVILVAAAVGLAWLGTSGQQRVTTASGLQYLVLEAGEGPLITSDDALRIHFTGRSEDGEVFANTRTGQPLETAPDDFIPGFGEGLKLMRKGALYRLWIPPSLGYQGRVPPGAPFGADDTLVFDLEVVDVAPGMVRMLRMQQMQQMMGGQPGAAPGAAPGGPPPGGPGPGSPPPGDRR